MKNYKILLLFVLVLFLPLRGTEFEYGGNFCFPAIAYLFLLSISLVPAFFPLPTYSIILVFLYLFGLVAFILLAIIGGFKKMKGLNTIMKMILLVIGLAYVPYELYFLFTAGSLGASLYILFHLLCLVGLSVWTIATMKRDSNV